MNKVMAVGMMKDEQDVCEFVIRHLISEGVERIIIMDNDSTDDTLAIIEQLATETGRISVWHDHQTAYFQSAKLTWLAGEARKLGATWIVPFDSDELWCGEGAPFAELLGACDSEVVGVPIWNHFCTSMDADSANPFERMVYRRVERNPMDKIAYRWHEGWTITQGNHAVLDSADRMMPVVHLPIRIRHFPYRSAEHFVRKAINGAAAYAASNLDEGIGAHWRMYGKMITEHGDQAGRDWFTEHFYYGDPLNQGMVFDPAPYLQYARVIA